MRQSHGSVMKSSERDSKQMPYVNILLTLGANSSLYDEWAHDAKSIGRYVHAKCVRFIISSTSRQTQPAMTSKIQGATHPL